MTKGGYGLCCLTSLVAIFQLHHFFLEETGVPGKSHRPAAIH